jgi:PAS domain-containing protein
MSNIDTNLRMGMPLGLSTMPMEPFRDGFFAKMFEYMLHGVAYGKVLHHRGKPYDFIFLYTNPAFKNQLGRSAINGQRISELFPDLYESNSEMLSHLKPVPTGVHPQHFNIYLKTLKQWFSIQIFSPKSDHLFIIFEKFTPKVVIDEHYEQLIGEQKAILDSHIVGIAKIKERKFIWVNNAFASLLGTPLMN